MILSAWTSRHYKICHFIDGAALKVQQNNMAILQCKRSKMPNKLLYKCKIGLQCLRYSYLVLKSGFEMCPPTSAIRSSEGFGEVMEAQTVARL